MLKAGQIILDAVKVEIRKDLAKISGVRKPGDPVQLPKTEEFVDSFSFQLVGESTIEVTSTWPTAEAYTAPTDKLDIDKRGETGRSTPPFRMTWLTRDKIPKARFVLSNGEVVIRTTPDLQAGQKAWIHPGYTRYSFLERGLRKGRQAAMEFLVQSSVETLLAEYDLWA